MCNDEKLLYSDVQYVPRQMFGPTIGKEIGGWRELYNDMLMICTFNQIKEVDSKPKGF
jgi:hypothetical protein